MKKVARLSAALAVAFLLGCVAPARAAADAEIAKVTVRTDPSNPPVLSKISDISTVVSSNNGSVDAVSWYDSAGNLDTDTIDNCVYTVYVRVSAPAGYIYAADVVGAVNNSLATVTRADDGSYIELSRVIEPALVAPTIWWSPTGETVDVGGLASFAATASPYYTSVKWNLISPTGSTTDISTVTSKFPGVTYTQDDSIGRLNIHNVTADMDGWKVSCTFSGPGGSATTSAASIKVNGAAASPSPSPSPSPTPTPTAAPTDAAAETDNAGGQNTDAWSFDETGHWHDGASGELTDYAVHSFQWTTLLEATRSQTGQEKGICDICGYETVRSVEYEKGTAQSPSLLRIILYIVAGVVLVALLLMVIQAVSDRNYRRRRKKNRRKRRY